jgi:hypothetical protein
MRRPVERDDRDFGGRPIDPDRVHGFLQKIMTLL